MIRLLEKGLLAPVGRNTEVVVRQLCGHASPRGAVEETDLHQERFVDFFDRVGFFGEHSGECVHADRPTLVFLNDCQQQLPVDLIETMAIDFQHLQRRLGGKLVDLSAAPHLRVVTYPTQQSVGDTRCAP